MKVFVSFVAHDVYGHEITSNAVIPFDGRIDSLEHVQAIERSIAEHEKFEHVLVTNIVPLPIGDAGTEGEPE